MTARQRSLFQSSLHHDRPDGTRKFSCTNRNSEVCLEDDAIYSQKLLISIIIEPENDGLEDDFPFPGLYSQVPSEFSGCLVSLQVQSTKQSGPYRMIPMDQGFPIPKAGRVSQAVELQIP